MNVANFRAIGYLELLACLVDVIIGADHSHLADQHVTFSLNYP